MKVSFYCDKFREGSSQMGKKCACQSWISLYSRSSGVNIANSVSTPKQTILIWVLPPIQTFTYPNLSPVTAWKDKVGLCFARQRVDAVKRRCKWLVTKHLTCCQSHFSFDRALLLSLQRSYWHTFKIQVNVETFLTSNQHSCDNMQALRSLTLIMNYYCLCRM